MGMPSSALARILVGVDAISALLRGDAIDLMAPGLPELSELQGCPQTVSYHGEGDVATHTRMVIDVASDLADQLPEDTGPGPLTPHLLRLSALLHDVGKPETTVEKTPGRFSAHGHEEAGARIASTLFATHPQLLSLPFGAMPLIQAQVRNHMWTYHIDRVSPGSLLRATHVTDPRLQVALWKADTRGRICDDSDQLAKNVAYAELALEEVDALRPDSFGVLERATADLGSVPTWVRRQVFREAVTAERDQPVDQWTAAARLIDLERNPGRGSLTYTIGLPGLGKSTWARTVWHPATGGAVLSAVGTRKRDRKAASIRVIEEIPRLLAAGADDIPADMRICGENLYARHSIAYDELVSYFFVYNIWRNELCLSWDETLEWSQLLGLEVVPVLFRGVMPSLDDLTRMWRTTLGPDVSEGLVVRTAAEFPRDQFGVNVAKWVRQGHVQTSEHWAHQQVVPNRLT
ncbi:MAG TPA: hypothetical protein DEQ43_12680 [Nocardioides bacterium]|nr:hypothetical protein [Nocardioides sp.]